QKSISLKKDLNKDDVIAVYSSFRKVTEKLEKSIVMEKQKYFEINEIRSGRASQHFNSFMGEYGVKHDGRVSQEELVELIKNSVKAKNFQKPVKVLLLTCITPWILGVIEE